MEVAPFFVDFHHFLSIFTIFCRFSPFFVDFHHFLSIFTIFALLLQFTHFFRKFFLVKIAFSATSHVFCMYASSLSSSLGSWPWSSSRSRQSWSYLITWIPLAVFLLLHSHHDLDLRQDQDKANPIWLPESQSLLFCFITVIMSKIIVKIKTKLIPSDKNKNIWSPESHSLQQQALLCWRCLEFVRHRRIEGGSFIVEYQYLG